MDVSFDMIKHLKNTHSKDPKSNLETMFVVGDEEFLSAKESSLDLVIGCLGLHWTNDLPGAMIQLFLVENFKVSRGCPSLNTHTHANTVVRDAGDLLRRAGFSLPNLDVDEYTVRYESALELVGHLRAMGEMNALFHRISILKRETALATAAIYMIECLQQRMVTYMIGWREHSSQQKPKTRGSVTVSFKDIQK